MARSFDGISDSMSVTDFAGLHIPAPLTVSMWWRATTGISAFDYILSKIVTAGDHSSWAFGFNSNARPRFILGYDSIPGTFIQTPDQVDDHGIQDGNWHLWTGTYDGTILKLYIDSIEHASVSEPHFIEYANFPLFFGSFDGTQLYGAGDQAEVSLWSIALGQAEVNQLAAGFSAELVRPDSLAFHWQMEGTPDPGYDVDLHQGTLANVLAGPPDRVAHPPIRRPMAPIYPIPGNAVTPPDTGAATRFFPFFIGV